MEEKSGSPAQPPPVTGWHRVEIFIWPSLLTLAGLLLIVGGPFLPVPQAGEMIEVRGRLASLYFDTHRRSKPSQYVIYMVLEDSTYIRNALITWDNANFIFNKPGMDVRTYVEPDDLEDAEEEGMRGYGLWVEGRELESLEDALYSKGAMNRYLLPIFGIGLIIGGFFAYWNAKKNKEIEDGDA
jgi:hypothetical protein